MYTLKKSLGQHFLRDEVIARRIVDAVLETQAMGAGGACLLEVGPGGGALTRYFLQAPGIDFKTVELDGEKVLYLKKTWPVLEDKIIHASILDIAPPFPGRFSVVGNFPYNISSQILFRMLDWRTRIDSVTGMFQKEVADRVAARHGSKTYGVISVLIQAFFKVELLFGVARGAFNPPPKVESAVIRLFPRQMPVGMRDEKSFFGLVKTAFNQRRKTLRNAAKALFEPGILEDALFDLRAEQLSVEAFGELTWKMK